MKKVIIIIAFALPALLIGLEGCKKEVPRYTIQGTIQYGPSRLPYKDQLLSFTLVEGLEPPHNYTELGEAKTNDTGGFSFTYEELKTKRYATIAIYSQFLTFGGIPDNENVNRIFYRPTHGTLEIFLQTDNPLEKSQDTLFWGYPVYNAQTRRYDRITDTILESVNGFYQSLRVPTPSLNIYWGRSKGEYDSSYFPHLGRVIYADIEGDPVVNKVTINY
ncbi:MAG: hypothetical protein M3Q97_06590 [Bacteroidota bacterium]|nr:hypothetical protein [Bacteroidota bacterium]